MLRNRLGVILRTKYEHPKADKYKPFKTRPPEHNYGEKRKLKNYKKGGPPTQRGGVIGDYNYPFRYISIFTQFMHYIFTLKIVHQVLFVRYTLSVGGTLHIFVHLNFTIHLKIQFVLHCTLDLAGTDQKCLVRRVYYGVTSIFTTRKIFTLWVSVTSFSF